MSSVDKKTPDVGQTNEKGEVTFTDLKKGIYDVTVEQNNRKVGENIINVSGSHTVLSLGINLDTQKNNPLLKDANTLFAMITASPYLNGGVLVLGVLLGIGISLVVIKRTH